ncbi:MAG: NADH:flavin oxidoreductase [Rhodobacteraceae bacterium]|jgi:2,4-dienoyl-CoA reductase-like NADH-dependent reductase (Old Yellow Enzyme family)|nr:NADH:flavin oxidoreductase [Paracoccaceae bacterium]
MAAITVRGTSALIPTAAADPLLTPFRLGHLTLRNRIMSTSHACGLEEDGMPKEAYQRYHEEKAKGGLALTMFGGSSNVAIDSPSVFRQLNLGTDAVVPWLEQFSGRIHARGAAIMCQLTHLGRRGEPYAGAWLPAVAPSPLRETMHRAIPREMDEHDIARIIAAYAAAARRCLTGGLDGVETLTGGHLPGQFLSPLTNRRTDRFGGSLENRMRFVLMLYEAIRKATHDRPFLVGIRWVIDEGLDGGLDTDEALAVAERLKAEGLVDFFNAIFGTMDTHRALAEDNMPGMGQPLAPWVARVGAFRRAIGLPVFHAARIADVASARHAVAGGHVDMVGMTRAQIADPHLAVKLAAGQEARIRPCVGAALCNSRHPPTCFHNPATGRETMIDHAIAPAPRQRRVVVVGAGPAGLEAARVAGERGHSVVLFEAAARPGGQILLAARGTWRRDLIGIVDWRVAELARLGVDLRLNQLAEAADILAEAPEAVILATGGAPAVDLAEGAGLATTAWDVLSGAARPAGEVLVFDGTGRHPGPLVAEAAAVAGAQVSYVSLDATLGEELADADRVHAKRMFLRLGIRHEPEMRLVALRRHANRLSATLVSDIDRSLHERIVDQAVVEQGTLPAGGLFVELRARSANGGVTDLDALAAARPQPAPPPAGFELHRIGDALASRNVHAAVFDALRLCNAI